MAKQLERDELARLALKALAQRDLSEATIASRLAERAANPLDVSEVLQSLRQDGWLNDLRAARSRARVLAERGWARARIDQELRSRGYAVEAIGAAVEALGSAAETRHAATDAETLRHLVEHSSTTPTATLYRRLVAKGFTDEAVADALREAGRSVGDALD